jgi:hypothetical protein
VGHDLEVPGPVLPLAAGVEARREDDVRGERPSLVRTGGLVENDVIDDQFGGGVRVELDVVDALPVGKRPPLPSGRRIAVMSTTPVCTSPGQPVQSQVPVIAFREAIELDPKRSLPSASSGT